MENNSVLKGLKPRTPGNIVPNKSYDDEEREHPERSSKDKKPSQKTFKNQQYQIKISDTIKEELNALKVITKTKFDYEIVELLIDSYVRNEMPAAAKRKFKAMTSEE